MCICTARALSLQMASCLLHSGFHLEELFCICLQNWSQLCSSYQSVTWKREVVLALFAEDQCCDPPAFRRINLRDKFSAISFPQQSCLEQTPGLTLVILLEQSWVEPGQEKCIHWICDIKDCPAGVWFQTPEAKSWQSEGGSDKKYCKAPLHQRIALT